ncbi:NAD(P)-binding protein [Rhizophagus irregularis]|uniref:NAD(P)-binding protein n=2 Tax=Rhizophagus irregularis TaxID=588596 RepID=A0A2I1DR76_9GLOM|nr:NAD(P)-binding protein [Rhizophagus irregularis]PKC70550.1 NAD(P)-binding protein [Rhizophagus irregularis]PKY12390.1 NAD(P)-binding protein [Rhizophagus irregularis]
MSQKPLIVVSGATGAQGGSVANSLLATGNYRVRALTRNPDSDKAKALASKGAEVFKCNLSIREDVKNALSGADIAWIVTNFWDPSIYGKDVNEEERQGKMISDIAKEEGVNWLIYSHVEQYIRTSGIPNMTFVYLGFYNQNIGANTILIPNENDEVELAISYLEENDQLPMIDVDGDTGPIVAKIIEEGPDKWNGKRVPVAAEFLTMKQIVDILTKVTGKKYKLKTMGDDDIAKLDAYVNNEQMKQMFKFIKEFGVFGKSDELRDISIAKKLHPNIKTFEQYGT